jgi:hypothetical protein
MADPADFSFGSSPAWPEAVKGHSQFAATRRKGNPSRDHAAKKDGTPRPDVHDVREHLASRGSRGGKACDGAAA